MTLKRFLVGRRPETLGRSALSRSRLSSLRVTSPWATASAYRHPAAPNNSLGPGGRSGVGIRGAQRLASVHDTPGARALLAIRAG